MEPYKVIYSKRRSIQISVSDDNEIVVRCPNNISNERLKCFIAEKQSWIDKILSRNTARLHKESEVLNLKAVYIDGKQFPLFLGDKNLITQTCVCLKRIEDIQKQFTNWFSKDFLGEVEYISGNSLIFPLSVKIKNYRSRWGCCDIKGNICFNYRLLMLPQSIREYVIIHELCHIRHHNHSVAFWNLVESYLPNYKALRKELRNYDFLTKLY